VFISVSDTVGPSDINSVVTLSPILVNDQPPVLDLNGLTVPGIDYTTTFNELSTGTQIIGEDAILYDRDSGFSTVSRIEIELVNPQIGAEILVLSDVVAGFILTGMRHHCESEFALCKLPTKSPLADHSHMNRKLLFMLNCLPTIIARYVYECLHGEIALPVPLQRVQLLLV